MLAPKASPPKAAKPTNVSRNQTLPHLRISHPVTTRRAVIPHASETIAHRATTVAVIAEAIEIADVVDAGDVLEGVEVVAAVAGATGIGDRTDRAAAATCLRRSMLRLKVTATIAGDSTTAGRQTIAGPALPSKSTRTTLCCRANRLRSIARGQCLLRLNRLATTSQKNVSPITNRRLRVPQSACNLELERPVDSPEVCRTGC